jgi:tRNA nucleotidyltransferase (CCA-adding enzyme)
MNSYSPIRSSELVQTDPALGILRLAALSAGPGGRLDDDTLDLMYEQVEAGVLTTVAPAAMWPELERGLMSQAPSHMLRALSECGALRLIVPEVAAVFGVPQISDDPGQVDIGLHLLRVLDEAAACHAPLPVRYAALVMHVGKADSPKEHLPVHYRHVERGQPRILDLSQRFGVPDDCRELALLALSELERVHRVTPMRAGPIAAMLERVDAFRRPQRFQQLLTLCACDYRAYGKRNFPDYPKAALLQAALEACRGLEATVTGEALQEARAQAIAAALRSERWSVWAE